MRVFLIVLDSFGIGELPDAEKFGDKGSNTLKACFKSGKLSVPNMKKLGLFNIDGVDFENDEENPTGSLVGLAKSLPVKILQLGIGKLLGLYQIARFQLIQTVFQKKLSNSLKRERVKKFYAISRIRELRL